MYKVETRSIEIRLADDPDRNGPGILQGTLMPYGETASDRQERFEPGSLYWPEGGVVLREMHDRKQPITRFEPTATDAAVELRVALAGYPAGQGRGRTGAQWHPAGLVGRVPGRAGVIPGRAPCNPPGEALWRGPGG